MPRKLLLLVAVLAACNTFGTAPEEEIVATIQYGSVQPPDVILPDTVHAGAAFDVVIKPKLACGSDAIPAAVSITGNLADVVARAVIPAHERGTAFSCEGRILDKSIGRVVFASPGIATVRVHGRDGMSGGGVTAEYLVMVISE